MKRLARSKVLYTSLLVPLSYLPALFLHPITAYIYVGSVLFTTSLCVMYAYWPSYKYALFTSTADLDYIDAASMGIMLIFGATALREGYITIYREFFPPVMWTRTDQYYMPLTFFRYLAGCAGLMLLSARKAMMGPNMMHRVPGWPMAFVALASGLSIATYLVSRYENG